jgi:hypothetical protein
MISPHEQEHEAALRWVAAQLAEAAAHTLPDADQLAQAFRVLFHAPADAKRLPSSKEQWFLIYHKCLWTLWRGNRPLQS